MRVRQMTIKGWCVMRNDGMCSDENSAKETGNRISREAGGEGERQKSERIGDRMNSGEGRKAERENRKWVLTGGKGKRGGMGQ